MKFKQLYCRFEFKLFFAERKYKKILAWSQRVAAAVGIAKGIQFLHTGIVPGSSALKLKTTDILLDLNFVAKISSHNLPLLTEYTGKVKIYIIYAILVLFLNMYQVNT